MHNLITAYPLYNFLNYCNKSTLDKNILDCGAGGSNPPLSLFHEFGYETHGIELCCKQLESASKFCKNHNVNLNIIKGDMLNIPFDDETFSFLFSYNTSVHMKKTDFYIALNEFYRVIKKNGLCYVNFLSEECSSFGNGKALSDGEFLQIEDNEEVIYCHYKDSEIEQNLNKFEIIYKEKRIINRKFDSQIHTSAFIDYILKKK